jgi:hypothetical protein
MKLTEAINRGFNLLGVSIVGLSGLAFMPEIFLEKDWDDKADDILILLLAIVSIVWYLTGQNKYKRSIAPVILTILSLLTKIGALIIEFKDKDAAGDDFGALVLFVLATGLVIYQYTKTKKLLAGAE